MIIQRGSFTVRLAGTEYNLDDGTYDIFVSGCTRKCVGCFNPEVQNFAFGEEIDIDLIIKKIQFNNSMIKAIRVMGGDLLCQDQREAEYFTSIMRGNFSDKPLILYTGALIDDIPHWCYELFDSIKYGPYIESLKCNDPRFGSSNQKIINKGVDYK